MNFVLLNVFVMIVFISLASSNNEDEEFDKKYCEPTLSDAKISEMEKCESSFPEELKQAWNQCLKEMNKGTTYKDLRNTYCDKDLRKQFYDWQAKKIDLKTLEKKYNMTEIEVKARDCILKVLEKKN